MMAGNSLKMCIGIDYEIRSTLFRRIIWLPKNEKNSDINNVCMSGFFLEIVPFLGFHPAAMEYGIHNSRCSSFPTYYSGCVLYDLFMTQSYIFLFTYPPILYGSLQ